MVVLCGPWVLSLVEELRFCMPQSTVKKKKGGGETQKLEIVRHNPLIEGPKENIHKLLLKL